MLRKKSDTHPQFEKLQLELLRQASPTRKMKIVAELNETVRQLMLSGLEERFPEDSPQQRKRRLAGLMLGEDTANKVYGPIEG